MQHDRCGCVERDRDAVGEPDEAEGEEFFHADRFAMLLAQMQHAASLYRIPRATRAVIDRCHVMCAVPTVERAAATRLTRLSV